MPPRATALPTAGSGGFIGGSLGSTDNALVRVDGATGGLAQGSSATISDAGLLTATSIGTANAQITGGSITGAAHGARTTSSGTDTIVLTDVNGAVVYGASSTVTITSGLPTGSSLLVAASATATLTWSVSGGESISEASTVLNAGEGRLLLKESATQWRVVQGGSGGVKLYRIAVNAVAAGLRFSLDSSTDGGATWTAGTQVAADATSDTDSCLATVDASGITVPSGSATGTTLAGLQRWTVYLDGTGGLGVNLAPTGANVLIHLAAQCLIGSGSGDNGSLGLAFHPKGSTARGWWTAVRCSFGGGTKAYERFTGGSWAAGSGLFSRDGLGMTTEMRNGGTGVRSTELIRSTSGSAWGEFTTDNATFTSETALAFSVTIRRYTTTGTQTVIPFTNMSAAWMVLV